MPRRVLATALLVGIVSAAAGVAGADPGSAVVTVYPSWSARTRSHPYVPGPYGPGGRPGDPFEIHIDGRLIAPYGGDWFLCVRSTGPGVLLASIGGGDEVRPQRWDAPAAAASGTADPARPSPGTSPMGAAQPIPTSILAVTNTNAYPNPFNPFLTDVTLDFSLNQDASVIVYIYDWTGRFVNQIDLGSLPSGPHSAAWGGQTSDGRALGNGTYLCRIVATTSARQSAAVLKVVVWNEQ